ncbi:M15 family metallopeptidase [Clostridium sp.]|uniref:M15 family metallopeptidase n=1 Tax=Clostridium sp. TaxID=1506 RepID=UPI0032169F80
MKKLFICGLLILGIFIAMSNPIVLADDIEETKKSSKDANYNITMKQDILTLMMAYPEYISGIEKAEEGKVFLITTSGKKILYDDKQSKNFNQKMDNADIQDILEEIYPLTIIDKLLEVNRDPGRFRCYALLNEVYGHSEEQVSKNLIGVPAPYKNYQFNKNNGAAESLKSAMGELKSLSESNGAVAGLINPINGTFNYRVIAGTGKLSPHAYGIAIDINSNPSDYWKWATREAGEKRMLSYPKELVEIFERNNFVWGGKWGHFDILHFEYRPEVIIKAKYFGEVTAKSDEWFGEIPRDEKINEYINIIEDALN